MHETRPAPVRTAVVALLLAASAAILPAAAQEPDASAAPHLRFQHLTPEDGLSLNLAWSMLQDRRGFMWFGTEDGLNRYDGYQFTIYKSDPFDSTSLVDDNVYALAEDREGIIWIGTSSGLSRLDPATGQFRHFRHNERDATSIPPGHVDAVVADSSGEIWVGMSDAGLSLLDPRTGKFRHFRHDAHDTTSLSSNVIRALHLDERGELWVGTTNGLNRLTREGRIDGSFRRYHYDPGGPGPGEPQFSDSTPPEGRMGFVVSVCEDPVERDRLWLWTGGGLVSLRVASGEVRLFTPPRLPRGSISNIGATGTVVLPDPRAPGIFWIASRQGLYHFDVGTGVFTPYYHDPDRPTSIAGGHPLRGLLVDRTGLMWVQTDVNGIDRFDPAGAAFAHFVPQGKWVTSIAEDAAGGVWLVSANGLNRLDRATGIYSRDPIDQGSDSAVPIRNVYADRAGTLWASRGPGVLDRIELDQAGAITGRYTRFTHAAGTAPGPGTARVFHEDPSGTLWAGDSRGVARLDSTGRSFVQIPLIDVSGEVYQPRVQALFKDVAGVLWIGAVSGLFQFDPDDGSVRLYRHDPRDTTSLTANNVQAIHERTREPGVLWIGHFGGGLDRFDTRTGRTTHFSEKDGLSNNTVYAIFEDERGHLWMSTNNGISEFDPDLRTFTNYGTDDGSQGTEFNLGAAYQNPRTGEIFFGGTTGFNAFLPRNITRNERPPLVHLTGLRIANQPVDLSAGGEIRLRPSERMVTFEYVGLHFAKPAGIRYTYRLDGFNEAWIDAGTERTATYTNLDPGTYTFHVKAASSDGVWNEEGASIRLVVLPSWWQTVWARLLGLIAVGLAVYGIHRVRENRRRMAAALRFRIAADLHDEMGGGLSQVSLYSELIRHAALNNGGDGIVDDERARMAAWASHVGEQARTLSDAMRDVVWAIRPNEGGWEDLELRMKDAAVALLAPRGVTLDMDGEVTGSPDLSPTIRQNVLLIVKEALHNAARHSAATHVDVRWRLTRRVLWLRIHDDGQGFEPSADHAGLGLVSMRRRADAIGGTLDVDTAPGRGTTLTLEVPVGSIR